MRTLISILIACLIRFLLIDTVHAQWVQTSLDSANVSCFAVSGLSFFVGLTAVFSIL